MTGNRWPGGRPDSAVLAVRGTLAGRRPRGGSPGRPSPANCGSCPPNRPRGRPRRSRTSMPTWPPGYPRTTRQLGPPSPIPRHAGWTGSRGLVRVARAGPGRAGWSGSRGLVRVARAGPGRSVTDFAKGTRPSVNLPPPSPAAGRDRRSRPADSHRCPRASLPPSSPRPGGRRRCAPSRSAPSTRLPGTGGSGTGAASSCCRPAPARCWSVLTYQALATFEPDDEVDEDGHEHRPGAWLALERLVEDPRNAAIDPMLVTGRRVAANVTTVRAFVEFVAFARAHDQALHLDDVPGDGVGIVDVTGRWSPRRWVRHARGVNVLTTSTTPGSVVQTRGRAPRTDPAWPEEVANNWSVGCVAPEHPKASAAGPAGCARRARRAARPRAARTR